MDHDGPGLMPENQAFTRLLGRDAMVVTEATQLNILGQTFRPIFCGRVAAVTDGYVTLDPVMIKMSNAPFHQSPTPLSFPIEHIAFVAPFDSQTRFPIP